MRALDLEVTARNIYLILELHSNKNTYRTSLVIAHGKLLQKVATYSRGPDRDRNASSEAGEALELFERIQRPNCPEALSVKTTVALCMMHMCEHEKAEALLRRNTTTLKQVLGLDHHETITNLNLLA